MERDLDDAYLVARAQDGFLDAFEMLVVRHQDGAYRVALRMLDDPQDAQDATQEALVDAWRGLAGFTGASSFRTWLYRILVNRCLQHQRRGREGAQPLPAELPGGSRPEELVEARSRTAALRAAIAALPTELCTSLVLYQFGQFSYVDVAAMLGVRPATVRGRIYRARQELAAAMREWS